MNPKNISLAIIGKNRIGLVSDFTKFIYDKQGNILKSRMLGYNSSFILSLNIDAPDKFSIKNLQESFKKDIEIFDNNSIIKLDNKQKKSNFNHYKTNININLADTPGIIHRTTNVLANNKIDINELVSDIDFSAFSSVPLFNLSIEAAVPSHINIGKLYNEITDVNRQEGSLSIEKID